MASPKSEKNAEKLNFEATVERLEALVQKMEDSEISLEQALEAFEDGIKLTRNAQAALNQAEQKVQLLLAENDAPVAQDFRHPDEEDA